MGSRVRTRNLQVRRPIVEFGQDYLGITPHRSVRRGPRIRRPVETQSGAVRSRSYIPTAPPNPLLEERNSILIRPGLHPAAEETPLPQSCQGVSCSRLPEGVPKFV
jgi:hypothetical protein